MDKFYKLEIPLPPKRQKTLVMPLEAIRKDSFDKPLAPLEERENFLKKTEYPHYCHWIDIKNKSWLPKWPREEIWAVIKTHRQTLNRQKTLIKDDQGRYFSWSKLLHYDEFFHKLDRETRGISGGLKQVSEQDKECFITRNSIEEAISSSQLEGANTSRSVARKMLQEGRKPRDYAERMIVNNYRTMQAVEKQYLSEPLTLQMLYELHALITEGTLDTKNIGCLRSTYDANGKLLVIKPFDDETISYIAPPLAFVEEQLPILIDFSNNKTQENFIHPVVKAIMLHFWIGLLHPFEDGNGRLARILFYWYMLKEGYWAFAYLTLSEHILKAPKQYTMAYIFSEQDDNDLTYFVDYNIRKLQEAQEQFRLWLEKQMQENVSRAHLFKSDHHFNDRQTKLLHYFYQNMHEYMTVSSYIHMYKVSKGTAITDLKKLQEDGFLTTKKKGRHTLYIPADRIQTLF